MKAKSVPKQQSLLVGLLLAMSATSPVQAQTSRQTTAPARPHGCIADGAAGAVAGHFVRSGHSVMGAIAGCSYGAWQRHKWKKEMKAYDSQKRTIITHSDNIGSHFQSHTDNNS